jgi:tetratricopeptide (TPR) repeat protein
MTNKIYQTTYQTTAIGIFIVMGLTGCVAPSPYYGGPAPVVDRSMYNQQQATMREQGPIEVTPLERQQPIVSQQAPGQAPGFQPMPNDLPPQSVRQAPTPAAAPPPPAPAPAPEEQPAQGNQAIVALLDSAANHVGGGELDKAASDLERALRIDPGNAAIWHDLGQIRLHQRQYDQAEAMASKSNALAGSNRSLQARNWRLMSVARRSQGDAAGADAAEAQAVQLER